MVPVVIGAKSAGDFAGIDGSPAPRAGTKPFGAGRTGNALKYPPMQPKPAPSATGAIVVEPCSTMLSAPGRSPDEVSCSVSAETLGTPAAVSCAPLLATELSKPCPAAPLLLQGQAASDPSQKQMGLTATCKPSKVKSSKAIGPWWITTEWIRPGKLTVIVALAPPDALPSEAPAASKASSVETEDEFVSVI